MTKLRMFILCIMFALAWSRPSEQQDEKQSKEDDPERGRLVGFETICPNMRSYAEAGNDGITRFRFCWNEPGWEADKQMSEDAARAWERVASISMEFQDNCDNRQADVTPIYIRDVRPFVMSSYENCKVKPTQMVLNFPLTPTSGYGWCNNSPDMRANCVKFIAMHEMGHAIGFRHEQDHPSSTCNIDRNYGFYSVETQYDPNSIMNYCNNAAWNNPQLSQLDIQGVRKVYGQR